MILTVGHGAQTADELGETLRTAGVEVLFDIRRYPGSRRHPQFNAGEMSRWLGACAVDYRWVESLGGRRQPAADSPNVGLDNDQFRAYADHMATDEFRAGMAEVLEAARSRRVAVMCSETVWWRCHRRLLADHLELVEGDVVEHLFPGGRRYPHAATEGAAVVDGRVVYPAP